MINLLFQEHGHKETFKKESYLFRQGDLDDQVFLVCSGLVKIIRDDSDGHEQTISIRTHNDLIGLAEVFLKRQRQCSAMAVNDSVVLKMTGTSFTTMLMQKPELSLYINKILSYRLRHAEDRLFSAGVNNVSERFCKLLLYFSELYSVESMQGTRINLKLTHQEWAAIVGTSRQTITTLMNDLKKDQIISIDKKYVYILDIDALKGRVPLHW